MQFSEFQQKRIALYLADVQRPTSGTESTSPTVDDVFPVGALESRQHILNRFRAIYQTGADKRYEIYIRQAQMHFAMVAPSSHFSVVAKDNRSRYDVPTIVKSRRFADRDSKAVLLPLNWRRHWYSLAKLTKRDCPFEDKDDQLIWRGTTTGFCGLNTGLFRPLPEGDVFGPRYQLAHLTDLAPGIDLKFTEIVQAHLLEDEFPLAGVQARMAPRMSMGQQLKSKFLLSLEGNDVASGLKWMLASSSTVLMPPPTCETWFCEGDLVAWEHYVPVKQDLSDINDAYEWCLTNPAKCKDISRNGRAFVAQFLDYKTERAIIREVVQTYLESSSCDMDYAPPEKLRQVWNHQVLRFEAIGFKTKFRDVRRGFGPISKD